jgi:uncharacterized membrane protein YccC
MGTGSADRRRTFTLTLIGRREDVVTAGITTAVVMVVAGQSQGQAWLQPILRLIDTVIGVAVGLAAVWIVVGIRRTTSGNH